jgi:hypothetical protein
VEVENVVTLTSARDDAKGLVQKVAEEHGAQHVDEETFRNLSEAATDAECRWEVFEMEPESNLRSSPFCRPGAPSCATPLLVPHG